MLHDCLNIQSWMFTSLTSVCTIIYPLYFFSLSILKKVNTCRTKRILVFLSMKMNNFKGMLLELLLGQSSISPIKIKGIYRRKMSQRLFKCYANKNSFKWKQNHIPIGEQFCHIRKTVILVNWRYQLRVTLEDVI